jgi:hypothetical protein
MNSAIFVQKKKKEKEDTNVRCPQAQRCNHAALTNVN